MRNMARGTEYAFEVPDRFGALSIPCQSSVPNTALRGHLRIGIDVIQKSPAVLLSKDPRKAPGLLLERLYVLYLNDQDIPGLCTLHLEWTTQVVNPTKVNILHIIGAVIIPDLTTSPINTFYLDNFSIFYRSSKGDWKESNDEGRYCCQDVHAIRVPPVLHQRRSVE